MGIRSAKEAIREARLKAGLTQEELSEGICAPQSLSRIETGTADVGIGTFQALMEHAGAPCERFPVFASRDDFECFYALKHARFYLDAWQLTAAMQELQKLVDRNWANNKLYYQEWLLLHCRLQSRSCRCEHQRNYDTLLKALHVTRPSIDLLDFRQLLLSQNEIQLLTALAEEAFYLGRLEICLQIYNQIAEYLSESHFTALEKEHMMADSALVYGKYLLSRKEYDAALEIMDSHRHKMALNTDTSSLFELTFFTGLCHYYKGAMESANLYIKAAFYSAHAIDSCFATACREFLQKETDFPMTDYMRSLPDIPLVSYPFDLLAPSADLSDGTYNTKYHRPYTLGNVIQDIRMERHISQEVLALGLCSRSRLSKIENGTLKPNIELAEAFLQRLGVSERIFTFWGNEREAKLYDLKFKLTYNQILSEDERKNYLNEMEKLLNKKDCLYYQNYLSFQALRSNSPEERIATLEKALHLTLPDFDIHRIHSYRLSWEELSLLNNIAHEYRCTGEAYLSTLYFLQILSYVKKTNPDVLMKANFLPNTNYMYCHSLYVQKLYHEVLTLPESIDMSIMKFNINLYGGFLFYYSQALGECSHWNEVKLAATQACALNDLMELHRNSYILRKYFYEELSIQLDY